MTSEDVFIEIGQVAPQEIWDGVVARSIHGERVTMALIELAPNSLVPEHRHVHDQMGILVRGLFRFRVGSDTRELGPGGTRGIRGGVLHKVEVGRRVPSSSRCGRRRATIGSHWTDRTRGRPRGLSERSVARGEVTDGTSEC